MSERPGGSWAHVPTTTARPWQRAIYLRDLLRELVVRDMKLRYERSVLGVLWAVVNPLAQLVVFVVVFKYVIRLEIPNYPLFVFSGVVAWNWTREALMRSAQAITGNRDLIRQPGFPLGLLPVVSLATPLIDLLIALPVVVLFVVFGGGRLTVTILWLPVVIVLQFLLLQGLGYLVAASQVLFRDTGHLLGVVLMLGFYLTPVFYDVQNVPSGFRALAALNPMAHVVTAYRAVIMYGRLPDLRILAGLALLSAVLAWVGQRVFERASRHFAEEL
jgi:homopolymeric O-antigen transport system permease protein